MTEQQCWEERERQLSRFLSEKITFGKYRGETWAAILEANPSYIMWADQNVEWLNIPPEISTQAHANNSAKKETKQPYEYLDEYDDEPWFFDPLDDYSYGG